MSKLTKIETKDAPAAIGPYSQAIIAENFVFISGQIPVDSYTGKVVEGGIEAQTHQVFKNIAAILKAKGLKFKNVIKAEVFLKDLSHFKVMNDIYATYFNEDPKPARHAFEVANLPLGVLIEISCTAIL